MRSLFEVALYKRFKTNSNISAIEEALGSEGFSKFWDRCGKTGGAGFTALDAITGKQIDQPGPPAPKSDEKDGQDSSSGKPFVPSRENLESRDGKTIGISRGDMRATFMGSFLP